MLYAQVSKHEFVSYDDELYVTKNPYVQGGFTSEGLKWAFTKVAGVGTYWQPVTWLSHMLDWKLFNKDAGKHHLVSVFFHAANVLLLFHLLRRMTKSLWFSALAATLFAFHPLQVDSVAWVAERKNVLSTLFWLLTTFAYVRYVELVSKRESKWIWFYVATIVLFAVGLMCKPMLVTLPCTLLLLDFWPLSRVQREKTETTKTWGFRALKLFGEKIPLFVLSAISCLITIKGHEQLGMIQDERTFPLPARLANSVVGYATYLRKVIWPSDLAVFYPLPETWPSSVVISAVVVILILSVVALLLRRRIPQVLFGWLWFLGTLVPVIGILQVHDQAMADRFVYVPLIGLFVAFAGVLITCVKNKAVLFSIGGVAVLLCMILSAVQIGYWKNTITLMAHAAAVTKNNHLAYNNLGVEFMKLNRLDEAMENYTLAIQSKDNYPMAHSNLGVIYAQRGDLQRAMQEFQRALQMDPDYADALCNAGRVYLLENKLDIAVEHFRHAIRARPSHTDSHINLGHAYSLQGKFDEAIGEFVVATRLPPVSPDVYCNLGFAFAQKGRFDDAVQALNQALQIDPESAKAENMLGLVYEKQQRSQEAIAHYQAAARLAPGSPDVQQNLQRALGYSSGTKLAKP